LPVLSWWDDSDEWCGKVEEGIKGRVFFLAAPTQNAIGFCEDGPADMSVVAQALRDLEVSLGLHRTVTHHFASNGSSRHQVVNILEIAFCVCGASEAL